MAGGERDVIAIERRLTQPRWLTYAVPFVSVAVAFAVMAVVLLATGHDPIHTYRRLFDAAFHGSAAWTDTLTLATPLIFTGLAAAVAFRMQLFNIGAEGQLYIGAHLRDRRRDLARPAPRPRDDDPGDVRLRRGRRRALGADRRAR